MTTLYAWATFLLLSASLQIPEFSTSDSIVIEYKWNGLSELAIISANCTLRLSDSAWKGRTDVSVCSGSLKMSTDVSIPKSSVDSLMEKLGAVSISDDKYNPTVTHTDDYPTKKMTFYFEDDSVEFNTWSQGKHNTPWQVIFSDQSYVSNSKQFSEAFNSLWEKCKFDKIDSLSNLVSSKKK